jgi:hypothetical protein
MSAMERVWNKANQAFTAEDCRAFNKWRNALGVAALGIEDCLLIISRESHSRTTERCEECVKRLLDRVRECPMLLP